MICFDISLDRSNLIRIFRSPRSVASHCFPDTDCYRYCFALQGHVAMGPEQKLNLGRREKER